MYDEDRIEGSARNTGGKLQDAVGGLMGDTATQARGKANQLAGTAQTALASTADAAAGWTGSLADTVKDKPVMAVLAALSVGFVLRMLTHNRH